MSRGKGDDVAFQRYMRDVGLFSLLEPEEEGVLVRVLEEGRRATAAALAEGDGERQERCREARNQLAVANLRLVVPIARRCVRRRGHVQGMELLDLIQEGNIALILAAEEIRSGYGKFATFATPWVRRRIYRVLADRGRLIGIPVRVRRKLDRLRKEEHWLLGQKGRPPTDEELAAELGIDLAALAELRCAEKEVVSLDQPVPGSNEEEELVYEDVIEDPAAMAFAQRAEDRQRLAWVLERLDERSRRILEWRFGHGLTLDQIGTREDLTRERVRQIEREALEKLRR